MIRKTLTAAPSSYELKHVAERSRAGYFTNGQFIVAVLLAGFPVDMASGDYNPGIGVMKRSVRGAWRVGDNPRQQR